MGTTEQAPNPTGKGGFGDHPENINPGGRPKNSLKSYAAKKLAEMSDEEKDKFLQELQKDLVWRMAEGNPHQTSDNTHEVTLPKPLLDGKSSQSNPKTPEAQEED